jgi:hypothetical protein
MSELTKARNEARVKAEAVEQRLRKNGASAGQLGFDEARAARDKELAVARDASERIAAYERYAEEAERLERQIQKDIEVGKRPVGIGDIAHYERLQAEVELARAKVPASAATPDKSVVK